MIGCKELDENIIKNMGKTLNKRGPDDEGIFIDKFSKIAISHQRLSIQDLSAAGHQPMFSNSGRYVIAYNGEIYNHLELRKFLEMNYFSNNLKWKGHSDTETLIECIDSIGLLKTLEKIEGMFSFALWDKKTKNLYLVKDRLGEKPLYYGYNNGVFFFGSELKAFKNCPIFKPDIDRNSLALLVKYNFIPAPSSIYKKIYKLFPGSVLTFSISNNNFKIKNIGKYLKVLIIILIIIINLILNILMNWIFY